MSASETGMLGTLGQIAVDALGGLSMLAVAFVAWLGGYHVRRLDRVIEQVGKIRETYVTREELAASLDRIQGSLMQRLGSIETKIEENAKEAKQDRHDLRNQMTPVALDVARMAGEASAATKIAEALTNVFKSRSRP